MMNSNIKKTFIFFLIICLFAVLLINKPREIAIFVKVYVSESIYHIGTILFNNQVAAKRIENDYKVKFLPETQLINLNFIKKKIEVEKTTAGYLNKDSFKTFFLENYDGNLIIFSAQGRISFVKNSILLKNDINHLDKYQSSITSNLNIEKILDTYLEKNNIYISYVSALGGPCERLHLAKGEINLKNINFKIIYSTKECASSIQSGKIAMLMNEKKKIYLSTAADVLKNKNEQDLKPQDPNSIWGKTLEFKNENEEPIIFSSGHRNILGLIAHNGKIIATENGPDGGDEINLLIENGNYGWDIASYGKKYFTKINNFHYQDHEELGFVEPILTFLPSLGISQIISIPKNFNSHWKNNYLIGTLYGRHLLRIKFDKKYNKIMFVEKIFIGERIRDLTYLDIDNVIVLALEDTGSIGIISNIK